MTIIVPTRRLQIARNRDFATSRFTLDPLTDRITLRIGREITGGSRVFSPSSRIQTRIIVRAGTQDFLSVGSATGGIYPGEPGEEIAEYSLTYGLPRGFFGDTTRQRRLGETVSTFDVMVELLLNGAPIDTYLVIESSESEAPTARHHSSVAYDNAVDNVEVTGDGVLDVTHTASGSDRAVFMGVGAAINNITSTSFTYAGNAGTELWDIDGGFQNLAGYALAGDANIPTGAQTATSTLSGSTGLRQIIAVISMTGVDSTTPVGTAQTRSSASNQTSSTLTVTGTVSDGMIVDLLMVGNATDPANAVGANQTQRTTELESSSGNSRVSTSTQSSADGGEMSWTFGGSQGGNAHGAVEFKPAAGVSDIELVVGDAAHGHTADNLALIEQEVLAVADALHAHAADSVALIQQNVLAVAEASHSHAADNIVLEPLVALAVADALHAHSADNLALIEQEVIAIADALHGHTADTIGLLQQNLLVVADALHDHAADGIVLDLTTPLVVADAAHGHTADSLGLIQANVLAVAEATHGHAVDNLTLDTGVVLQVADAIHAHGVDNVALTQAAVLAVADALHAHAAENIVLSQASLLAVADAVHGHSADSPTLTLADILAVAEAIHVHTADTIALSQHSVLVVSDALHAHLADELSLQLPGFVPPKGRTFVAQAKDTTFIVQSKSTTFVVVRGRRTFNA